MKTFLKVDYWIQTVFLVLMCITIPLFFIPMFLLVIYGAWQLLSGMITALCYPALNRKMYLAKALGYLLFLFVGYLFDEAGLLPDFLGETAIGFILFWLIVPFAIGLWYYNMVRKDYHYYCKKKEVVSNTMAANSPLEKEYAAI